MKTFKTSKGTELPLLDLKGKDYLQVAHRLVWFREDHPDWSIETESGGVFSTESYAIFKATIKDSNGKVIATGHKREDQKHFQDYMEKAETGAIGRALALCGYGTQFAPDLDEGERLADSPIQRNDGKYRLPFTKDHKGKTLDEMGVTAVNGLVDYFEREQKKKPLTRDAVEFMNQAKIFKEKILKEDVPN